MTAYRMLDWDSRFFGFPVAQIASPKLTSDELESVIAQLRRLGVRLAYWPTDDTCVETAHSIAERLGGRLVDQKTTFFIDLARVSPFDITLHATVESYDRSMPAEQLVSLAIQSGEFSRFAVDPGIPRQKFTEMYTIWIDRSLDKQIAEEVLVVRDPAKGVVGMVTLGNKNGRGDIGLIAVDADFRGRKYGETLVRAAQQWFIAHGYAHGQVVTQGTNAPACKLYIRCGYSIEKVEPYFHFWL